MTSTAIINKVWNFCHTLRDDGVGYGDYLEQLTYLLFLKMADEYGRLRGQLATHQATYDSEPHELSLAQWSTLLPSAPQSSG